MVLLPVHSFQALSLVCIIRGQGNAFLLLSVGWLAAGSAAVVGTHREWGLCLLLDGVCDHVFACCFIFRKLMSVLRNEAKALFFFFLKFSIRLLSPPLDPPPPKLRFLKSKYDVQFVSIRRAAIYSCCATPLSVQVKFKTQNPLLKD